MTLYHCGRLQAVCAHRRVCTCCVSTVSRLAHCLLSTPVNKLGEGCVMSLGFTASNTWMICSCAGGLPSSPAITCVWLQRSACMTLLWAPCTSSFAQAVPVGSRSQWALFLLPYALCFQGPTNTPAGGLKGFHLSL